jgi:putative inorganic carbon (HCO3(-)) transporter
MQNPWSRRDQWIKILDETIGYCLALLLFLLFFEHTNTTVAALYLLPLILWITRMVLARDFRLIRTPISLPILAFVVMALISTVFSMNRWYSIRELRGEILKQILLFVMVANTMRTEKQIRNMLVGLFAGALYMSIVGIVGYYTGWTVYEGRTISWYSNKSYTSLGCYLAINAALVLAIVYFERNRSRIFWLLFMTAIFVWCILLTFTRGVWIALGIAGSFLSVARKKFIGLLVLAMMIFSLAYFPNSFRERFISIADLRNYPVPGAILSDRVLSWKSALDMIRDRPLIGIGYGPKLFEGVYPRYLYPGAKEPMAYAHNLFLDITVQMGIPGLIIFLWLIASFFRGAIATFRKLSSSFLRAVVLGSITGVLILLLNGLVSLLLFKELGLLIFILMGITYSRTIQEECGVLEWNHLPQRVAAGWVASVEAKNTDALSRRTSQ